MPSTHEGQDGPLKRCDKCVCFPKRNRRWIDGFDKLPRFRLSLARGVGNNPSPVSSVRRTNGGSRYAMPLRIKPERGQRSENIAKPSIKQLWAVLHDDVAGSNFANETLIFEPQSASFSGEAESASAGGNVLTGEAPTNDVNGNSIGSKPCRGEVSDVAIAGNVWPVFMKDTAGELLNLAKCNSLETASAFKAQVETANPGKQ